MLILLLQHNSIIEHYECHITTAMICHTCAFDLNGCVFAFLLLFFYFYKNCVRIISQVNASYISHNLLCSIPGIPTCQWCYIDRICLYEIDKLHFYCVSFLFLFYFAVCPICGWRKEPWTKWMTTKTSAAFGHIFLCERWVGWDGAVKYEEKRKARR